MLLIYVDKLTNRLGYTINLIFKEILKVDYMITTSKEQFIALNEAKLSYCENQIYDEIHISNTNLLFETNIHSLEINYAKEDGIDKIFKTYDQDDALGFDLFAATFYMVSRYEEYLPFITDNHLRFCANDSIAVKKGFYNKPVVNIWAEYLKTKLEQRYNNLIFGKNEFKFINTIDIDMAYCYKYKGIGRNIFGFCRDLFQRNYNLCMQRIKTLLNMNKDPYDCYDYILDGKLKHKITTIFFFLFAKHSKFDKSLSPYNNHFQLLIKQLNDFSIIGIHPSYYCMEYPKDISLQLKSMSNIIHKIIDKSRFHFLRFRIPKSYRDLLDSGITDDYSMGYADQIGFRAGICTTYNFYDLENDCITKLKIHPFMFMDVVLKDKLNLTENNAIEIIKQLIDEVKEVGGEFISIWHNESLSDYDRWKNWKNVYKQQIDYITK